MFNTIQGIVTILGFVLPGFIVADLSQRRRASRDARTDLELVLRTLLYAFLIHGVAAATGWTQSLVEDLQGPGGFRGHVDALLLYSAVVIIGAPTIFGLVLGRYLRQAEQRGRLHWFHHALGGHDHRNGWDFLFSRLARGARLQVMLKGATAENPRLLTGKFGRHSWAAKSPTEERDIYLEDVLLTDEQGNPGYAFDPPRGLWVAAREVDAIFVYDPPVGARPGGLARLRSYLGLG